MLNLILKSKEDSKFSSAYLNTTWINNEIFKVLKIIVPKSDHKLSWIEVLHFRNFYTKISKLKCYNLKSIHKTLKSHNHKEINYLSFSIFYRDIMSLDLYLCMIKCTSEREMKFIIPLFTESSSRLVDKFNYSIFTCYTKVVELEVSVTWMLALFFCLEQVRLSLPCSRFIAVILAAVKLEEQDEPMRQKQAPKSAETGVDFSFSALE